MKFSLLYSICLFLFFGVFLFLFSTFFLLPLFYNKRCIQNKHRHLHLKSILADKFKVRRFINNHFSMYIKLPLLYYVFTSPKTLLEHVHELQTKSFVIKTNNGSGYNLFFRAPHKNLKNQIISKLPLLNYWQNNDYGTHWLLPKHFQEPQYKFIYPRLILVEELLEQFFEIRIIVEDGKLIKCMDHQVCLPEILDTIYKITERIYHLILISFFRVDFYIVQNTKIYFSEISFTPQNCFL